MTIQITKKIVGFNAQMKQQAPEPIKTEPSVNEAPVEAPISNINYGIDVEAPSQLTESPDVLPEMDVVKQQEVMESESVENIFPYNLDEENKAELEEFSDNLALGCVDNIDQEDTIEHLSLDVENEIESENYGATLASFVKGTQGIDNLEDVSDIELEKFADASVELTKESPQIINTSAQFSETNKIKEKSIDTLGLDSSEFGHSEVFDKKISSVFEEANVREFFTTESIANVNVIDYKDTNSAIPETTYSLLNKTKQTKEMSSMINKEQIKTAVKNTAVTNKNEMHELIERPEMLIGSTYKVKTPLSEHAMYITINDMILNEGTDQETRQPFEVFINSKSMDHFQWIVALTRIISAVFRKGGDITFLVEELHSVFDPKGGYFKAGGQYMPSLVAEIGDVIERHLKMIGLIQPPKKDPAIIQMIEEKRTQIEAKKIDTQHVQASDFPKGAVLCSKCLVNAVILMDGCMTCLNCGDSKCG